MGRTTIAKSLLLPKVTHILTAFPILDDKHISKLEMVIYDFIWGGCKKRHAFNKKDAQCSFDDGGLEMPNLRVPISSYLFSWFRRALREEDNNHWRMHLDNLLIDACGFNFISLLNKGDHVWQKAQGKIANPFWKRCLKTFKVLVEAFLKHSPHLIVKYPIWECSAFKIGNRPLNPRQIENRSIAEKVNFAYDFIDGEGELITKSDLEIKIGSEIPQPVYLAVAQKLSNYATLPGEKYPVKNNPHIPAYAELFSISTKGCSKWAKMIHRQRTPNILSNEIKMSQKFDIQGGEERWKQAYLQNKMIRYGNNIRWLNSQIMRGSLPTNSYLLKAKIKNSDRCSF